MYTSANALHRVLVSISQHRNKNDRFRTVLAGIIGLEGEEGEVQAVVYLHTLVRRVRDDISEADISDEYKKTLKKPLSAFNGILSMSEVTQTLDNLKNSLLNPQNLNNLTVIDMALDGKVNRYDEGLNQKELISSVDEIKEDVKKSNLPDELKKALYRNLTQVRSAIEHFRFYGMEGLEEALSMLAAAAFITKTTKDQIKNNPDLFGKIYDTVQCGLRWINITKRTAQETTEAIEQGQRMYEVLENLM